MLSIDSVDLRTAIFTVVVALVLVALPVLAVLVRTYVDKHAAARRPVLPVVLPRNLESGWDRLDERGRPW